MDKVLLTTYRKLYKMSSRVDGSTGMRSILSCAPSHVYNHRRGVWVPINVAKLSSWAESRIFLDNLIRRLNGGRQFYIPPTTEADRALAEKKMAQVTAQAAAAGVSSPAPEGGSTGTPVDTSAAAAATTTATGGAQHGPSSSQVPLSVEPFFPLRRTLRMLFELTSFSMANLTNGFAAVKELSYVCDVTDKYQAQAVKLPAALRSRPRPRLERALEVDPIHHIRLIKGLNEEIMEHLRMSRRTRGRKASKAPPVAGSAAAAAAAAAATSPANAFDNAEGTEEERPTLTEEEEVEHEALLDEATEPGEDAMSDAGVLAAASAAAAAGTGGEEAPKHVQLLLSHPQLSGFFQHSVLLVVRNAENESAAFILNKPLENDEGLRMPVNAVIRLNRVHPIFARCLRNHTVMVGGPVMTGGSFDESVFLLHSVPGVPSALPLGNGLWLDGDLDKLMEKLQSGAASPEQVVVICGVSGWGVEQLSGEIEGGTWVVVSGDAADPGVPAFVMQLAHESGAHAPPMDEVSPRAAATAATTEGAVGTKEAEESEQQADAADPSRLSVRISANRRATESWIWAYDVLGEPLASLTTNQRPESDSDN